MPARNDRQPKGTQMTSTSDADMTEPVDTTALDRSREAIDEGREAAREALDDDTPTEELEVPAAGGDAPADGDEVTPRPS